MDPSALKTYGEDAAAAYLRANGYVVRHRNYRLKIGELDIIAMDGETLVFVEVKTRTNPEFADPSVTVHLRKRQRIRRLADAYLEFEDPDFEDSRFDVISVTPGRQSPQVEHLLDAF